MKKIGAFVGLVIIVVVTEVCQSLSLPAGIPDHAINIYNKFQGKAKRDLSANESQSLLSVLDLLTRQTMLQDFGFQERVRSEGTSGLKQSRQYNQGSKTYNAESYTGKRLASIHDHSNNIETLGMGELIAVMNGLEFRTRHNDYKLVKPHETSTAYSQTQPIPFPDVPNSVTDLTKVEEQITEMREYFKAWQNEDISHRNYTEFFKPVLCYMEGAWTISDSDTIEESFSSDRHALDATSWFDLQEKIRFTSGAGKKDRLENYAYLPTTILSMENGNLSLAQWNYRILCHPLVKDLKPSRLRLIDDIQARKSQKLVLEDFSLRRAARFSINPVDKATWTDKQYTYRLLDELMMEIPGLDNYQGDLTDDALGSLALHPKTKQALNTAYYHHYFKSADKDAMGSSDQGRGYSDPSIFMAMTTQPKIAPMTLTKCKKDVCTSVTQRWTYAIPMEIIYMTPLNNWNPYNIEYKGHIKSDLGKTVEADGRNGDPDKPLNGTHYKKYYRTPPSFFSGKDVEQDAADTGKNNHWVLNKYGDAFEVAASGTKTVLPDIPDLGEIRTRYPIMPIHQEDAVAVKEADALKDIVLSPITQKAMFYEDFPTGDPVFTTWTPPEGQPANRSVEYELAASSAATGSHTHVVTLTPANIVTMLEWGETVTVTTSATTVGDVSHSHTLVVTRKNAGFKYTTCDGNKKCADGHTQNFKTIKI